MQPSNNNASNNNSLNLADVFESEWFKCAQLLGVAASVCCAAEQMHIVGKWSLFWILKKKYHVTSRQLSSC